MSFFPPFFKDVFAQVADKLSHIVDNLPPAQDQVATDSGTLFTFKFPPSPVSNIVMLYVNVNGLFFYLCLLPRIRGHPAACRGINRIWGPNE